MASAEIFRRARGQRVGASGDGHGTPVCLRVVIASAAKQSRSLSADVFLDCFATLAITSKILKVFCPTAQAIFFFRENNPMHSRTLVDFKEEIVGWVSRRRNPPLCFPRGRRGGGLRRADALGASAGLTHHYALRSRRDRPTPPRSALARAVGSRGRLRAGRSASWPQ